MKMPNLRLYETQATASLLAALVGLVCVAALVLFVFHNFNAELMVVSYNPEGGLGAFRRPLVMATTPLTFLFGLAAGLFGFNSLGQKRNSKQGRSWLGLSLGTLVMAAAPVLFYAWTRFSEPLIRAAPAV